MSVIHVNNIKNIISLNNYILESLNSDKSLELLLENYDTNNKKEELNSDDEPIGGEQNPDEQNPDEQNPDEQNPDEQNPDGQNTDEQNPDEQNPDEQNPDEQNPDEQNPDEQNPDEQMSYDELLTLQFDITNQKFIQLQLFNKIQDLSNMINTINNYSLLNNDEQMKLDHIINYLEILKEIIFISDINVVYQTLGQLQVEFALLLTQLNDRLNQEEYQFQMNNQNKQN